MEEREKEKIFTEGVEGGVEDCSKSYNPLHSS